MSIERSARISEEILSRVAQNMKGAQTYIVLMGNILSIDDNFYVYAVCKQVSQILPKPL